MTDYDALQRYQEQHGQDLGYVNRYPTADAWVAEMTRWYGAKSIIIDPETGNRLQVVAGRGQMQRQKAGLTGKFALTARSAEGRDLSPNSRRRRGLSFFQVGGGRRSSPTSTGIPTGGGLTI